VDAIYEHLRHVLGEALSKSNSAVSQLGDLSEQLCSRLQELQGAVTDSHQSLQEAVTSLENAE
jgi:ABC-type transporter Mla subunit MlaD